MHNAGTSCKDSHSKEQVGREKRKGVLYTLGVELAEGREGSYYCKLWTGRDDHLPRRAGRQAMLLVVQEIMMGS